MGLFSKLFGGASDDDIMPSSDPVDHNGFLIYPEPSKGEGGFRIGARIEKTIDGVLKSHTMIRVDTLQSQEEATDASVHKAQLFIDQMAEKIFVDDE